MALKTKANIKTQLDAVAAALTLAYADTIAGIAVQAKNPNQPLRKIEKLLDISDIGVVTVNTAKWDAMWNVGGTVLTSPTQPVSSGSLNKKIVP